MGSKMDALMRAKKKGKRGKKARKRGKSRGSEPDASDLTPGGKKPMMAPKRPY